MLEIGAYLLVLTKRGYISLAMVKKKIGKMNLFSILGQEIGYEKRKSVEILFLKSIWRPFNNLFKFTLMNL